MTDDELERSSADERRELQALGLQLTGNGFARLVGGIVATALLVLAVWAWVTWG